MLLETESFEPLVSVGQSEHYKLIYDRSEVYTV